ncbi:MAG: hypothetical protein ACJAY8_000388 [Sphingobacteriales bacterium]
MKNIYSIFSVFLLSILFWGCELINPEEPIPAYIRIDTLRLNTTPQQGSDEHGLIDAWVFVNDNLLGIYQVPFEIPVLETGKNAVKILGGIKVNGQNEIRKDYPFLDFYTQEVDFREEETVLLQPTFEFYPNIQFWIEDFEDPGVKFAASNGSDTSLIRTSDTLMVRDGNASGVMYLDQTNRHGIVTTEKDFELPVGQPVYLEFDYNTDIPVSVGVFSEGLNSVTKINILTLFSTQERYSDGWNKMYLELSTAVSSVPGTPIEVFFESIIPQDTPEGRIILDNIKIVYP